MLNVHLKVLPKNIPSTQMAPLSISLSAHWIKEIPRVTISSNKRTFIPETLALNWRFHTVSSSF